MSLEKDLQDRAGNGCELCAADNNLTAFAVPGSPTGGLDGHVYICATCKQQYENPDTADPNHWRSLNDSMWTQVSPVQVMVYRMLHRLRAEGWPQDLLDMMYLDDATKKQAMQTELAEGEEAIIHKDAHGNLLAAGDTVTLIKDLKVKGGGFTAKRGTAVRRISLVHDNAAHIEGRVEGQQIVILTEYVKKNG